MAPACESGGARDRERGGGDADEADVLAALATVLGGLLPPGRAELGDA